jgi:copper resistance protein D
MSRALSGGSRFDGLAMVAAGVACAGMVHLRGRRPPLIVFGIAVSGAAALGWALAIEAYPTTYWRAQVPYLTVSVAHGRALYEAHCTSCHGTGGLGDGPRAARLPKPPANLSEPHTALHTAGDMFWWLTHGIPKSGMPGYASQMSEEERWDTINFLRAFSQGFESRVLGSRLVPGQAWLGAINFYLDGVPGPSELKGYRETHNVLLVFLGGASGEARAERLARAYSQFVERRTQVIAVPLAGSALRDDLPYPVVRSGGDEIWSAYQLLTRTIGNRGASERIGVDWQHAELLVDRFGYIRARWMVEDDTVGWSDVERLLPLLDQLNAESQIKPFPDDHIH